MKKYTKDKPPHYGLHPPYAAVCFFPRQAGRPDNGNYLEREYAGGLIGRKAKNFRGDFDIFALHLCLSFHFVCLSFPASQNNKKSADKIDSGT